MQPVWGKCEPRELSMVPSPNCLYPLINNRGRNHTTMKHILQFEHNHGCIYSLRDAKLMSDLHKVYATNVGAELYTYWRCHRFPGPVFMMFLIYWPKPLFNLKLNFDMLIFLLTCNSEIEKSIHVFFYIVSVLKSVPWKVGWYSLKGQKCGYNNPSNRGVWYWILSLWNQLGLC